MSTYPTKPPHISKRLKKHDDLFDKHLSDDLDEQTAVLKAHLLIEGIIRDFCYGSVPHPTHLRNSRLNFHQIVQLARSLMVVASPGTEKFWGMVNNLNKLRNLMAHELEPDQAKFDECRKALITVSGQPNLNACLGYLCGAMNALLNVSLELDQNGSGPSEERDPMESSHS